MENFISCTVIHPPFQKFRKEVGCLMRHKILTFTKRKSSTKSLSKSPGSITLGHLHLKIRSASFHSFKVKCGMRWIFDKIYKILVDILDLEAGFPLANSFIRSDFFRSKTIESRIRSYFFYFGKSRLPMRIHEKVASYEKIRKWKTGLIGQANGSKVAYLSVAPNAGPFKGRF